MNYYSHSGRSWRPQSYKTGLLNSILNVLAFMTLLAFGIATSYWLG